MRGYVFVIGLLAFANASLVAGEFRVMTWNILHGGREDGEQVGPSRVADVIRDSRADLVALQETYGSGEYLAEALGYRLHARGTNVSILSRFPIVEDLSVHEEFNCAGALIERPDGKRLAFYSIWLPYRDDIWVEGGRVDDRQVLLEACQPSADDLEKIRRAIDARLSELGEADLPVIIAGDFNSMSHLDYASVWQDQHAITIDWPTSHVLTDAGWRDAFRELHPVVQRAKDRTWSPRFPKQSPDRIDFIYYRAHNVNCREASVIDEHAAPFPSDHAAVLAVFQDELIPPEQVALRVVSYNIRHGLGNDDQVDLERTAQVLRDMKPDLIGLQEVDWLVERSGPINQPVELAKLLGMHPAFGSFMDHQGGRYGMALLSRFPIQRVEEIRLPQGNEPRIALAVDVRLPNGEPLRIVNVHFDWVDDDSFRYSQATTLADRLRTSTIPYVLMGDFNDGPASRTLALFRALAVEATKPVDQRTTYDSINPTQEIDYIFAAPAVRWNQLTSAVIAESTASDHRPVLATGRLIPGTP